MGDKDEREAIDQKLIHAVSHPLRVEILELLTEETLSPPLIAQRTGSPLSNVVYHTRVLADKCECVEIVRRVPQGGSVECFFRARPQSFVAHPDWRKIPGMLRNGVSLETVRSFLDRLGT